MLRPACPRAGPTGGAGLAAPALISKRMLATAFRLAGWDILLQLLLQLLLLLLQVVLQQPGYWAGCYVPGCADAVAAAADGNHPYRFIDIPVGFLTVVRC